MGPDKDEDRRLAGIMLADLYLFFASMSLILNIVTYVKHGWDDLRSSGGLWLLFFCFIAYWGKKSRSKQDKRSTQDQRRI